MKKKLSFLLAVIILLSLSGIAAVPAAAASTPSRPDRFPLSIPQRPAQGAAVLGMDYAAYLHPDGTVTESDQGKLPWRNIVAIAAGDTLAGLKSDGTVVCRDAEYNVSGWRDIVAISVGDSILGLRKDGTVLISSDNSKTRTALKKWNNIVSISAGNNGMYLGVKKDGTVVTASPYSTTFNFSHWRDIVQTAIGYDCFVGLRSDGTVVTEGLEPAAERQIRKWRDVVAVSIDFDQVYAVTRDGSLLCYPVPTVGSINMDRGAQFDPNLWYDLVSLDTGWNSMIGVRKDGSVVLCGGYSYELHALCRLGVDTPQHGCTATLEGNRFYCGADWTPYSCGYQVTIPRYNAAKARTCRHKMVQTWEDAESIFYYNIRFRDICIYCGLEKTYGPTPITKMRSFADTNDRAKKDIMTGTWKDKEGNSYPNALKFWVSAKPGYSNRESIEYRLNGDAHLLEGWMFPAEQSDSNTPMTLNFYLDGNLAASYSTDDSPLDSGWQDICVDLRGAQTLKIECVTNAKKMGHLIFAGDVYQVS